MNSRQLGILSAAAVLVVVGATWLGVSRTPRVVASDALYPALKGQLDKVTGIKVFKPGDELAVELSRDGKEWSVLQRNYPANAGAVHGLLLALETATVREQKTANADNYAALGVQELSAAGATGTRIELVGIEPPIKVIVGKQDSTQHGSFVRRAGEPQSWLISESLSAPEEMSGWLHRELLNIGADRVQEAAVQPGEGPRYSVFKKTRADANFDVAGIPKGRELNSVSAANSVSQSLVSLQLDDVRPAAELATNKPTAQVSLRTFEGLVLEVQGYAIDEQRWIVVKPLADDALAKRFHLPTTTPIATEAPASKNAKDAKDAQPPSAEQSLEAALAKVKTEAETLGKRLDGWAFAIAAYKYDSLFKPLDQLLKK